MKQRSQCPACGFNAAPLIVDLPFDSAEIAGYLRAFYASYPRCDLAPLAGTRFQLADCPACGCLYQRGVPDDAFLANFYRSLGTSVAPVAFEPYRIEPIVRELMMVVRFLQPRVPCPRVLDFGTGEGRWATIAAAAGLTTGATDLTSHAFATLQRHGIACFDPAALAPADFDFINTEQVCEHLAAPAAILDQLSRVLRPGGVLKIGVPHDPNLRRKLRQPDWLAPKNSPDSLNGVAPIEHLNHFEPTSLIALAVRAGLQPLQIRGWTLVSPRSPPDSFGPRQRLGLWLRTKIGADYRTYHTLTQTIFFEKPLCAEAIGTAATLCVQP